MNAKIKIIIIGSIILIIGTLFALWRINAIKLANTEEKLVNVTAQLQTTIAENTKLVEYNLRKVEEVNKIKQDYTKSLQNIPTDACGDSKPSTELLKYFKENN